MWEEFNSFGFVQDFVGAILCPIGLVLVLPSNVDSVRIFMYV